MYQKGLGVQQDYVEAINWYRKAAEQGYVEAQFNLGGMYYYGLGVNLDYVQAYAWYGIAAAGGAQPAQNMRDKVGFTLNSSQLEEAHELAKELWEKYGNKSKN